MVWFVFISAAGAGQIVTYWESWSDWDKSKLKALPNYVTVVNVAFGKPSAGNTVE